MARIIERTCLAIVLALTLGVGAAVADDYAAVGNTNTGVLFINAGSIKTDGTYKRAWFLNVLGRPITAALGQIDFIEYEELIDCDHDVSRVTYQSGYRMDGSSVLSGALNVGFQPVIPESNEARAEALVCRGEIAPDKLMHEDNITAFAKAARDALPALTAPNAAP